MLLMCVSEKMLEVYRAMWKETSYLLLLRSKGPGSVGSTVRFLFHRICFGSTVSFLFHRIWKLRVKLELLFPSTSYEFISLLIIARVNLLTAVSSPLY